MPPKPRIDVEQAIKMLWQGMGPTEVGRAMGETPQAISYAVNHRAPHLKTPSQVIHESLPWKNVRSEHKKASTWARIMNHAEYMVMAGEGMSHRKLEMLSNWYRSLEQTNTVVMYDPSIPPAPNAKHGGWGYVPREEHDGKLLLRVNEYVEMTDEAYDIWRLPERRPAV